MSDEPCQNCRQLKSRSELKQGWTNSLYCSESCERSHVSSVHASMPGGKLPRPNWVPHHVGIEISQRWSEVS